MDVILRSLGRVYDISDFVDKNIMQQKNLTGFFDNAKIDIPIIPFDAFSGIDLSKKIQRMSIVEITDLIDTNKYYVLTPNVEKLNTLEHKHTLELVELSYILKLRMLPANSITQPIVEKEILINELSGKDIVYMEPQIIPLEHELEVITKTLTPDNTIIEDRVIKKAGGYKINVSMKVRGGYDANVLNHIISEPTIIIKADGVEIYREEFQTITSLVRIGCNTTYELISGTEEITIYFSYKDSVTIPSARFPISDISLNITYVDESRAENIYLDTQLEKLLRIVNVADVPEFTLDPTTKARLSGVKAYDNMIMEGTLYDAVNSLAKYVRAKPKIDIVDNKKILSFMFFEDLINDTFIENEKSEQENAVAQINEYQSGLELKNNNVIKNTYNREIHTLRALSGMQVTTDNIGIVTDYPIDKIQRIRVSGFELKNTSNNVILEATEWVDITKRVFQDSKYNVLDSQASYDDRLMPTKNNHLFYVRGDNKIYGMSFVGVQYQDILTPNKNRALYEVIAAIYEEENPKEFHDSGTVLDANIKVAIDYYAYGDTNAVIYKDDQSGFEEKLIRGLNANERVNNAENLGNYARTKANATGGTRISKHGFAKTPEEMVKLGTIDTDYKVVSITRFSRESEIEFFYSKVHEYVYETEYVGIDSDKRLYRVPKIEFVNRVDKALFKMCFTKEHETGWNDTPFPLEYIAAILTDSASSYTPPKIAHITFDDKEVTVNIDKLAVGNVIDWKVKMQDNYSAGLKKLTKTLGDSPLDFTYQIGVPYCNIFGKANNVKVEYYNDRGVWYIDDYNDYPEGLLPAISKMGELEYEITKDAREHIAISSQLALLGNDKVWVYNGLTRYNRAVAEEYFEIGLAKLDYMPSKDDKFIDFSQVEIVPNTTELDFGKIVLNVYEEGHYAWFEVESGELLMVAFDNVIGDNDIYFCGEVYTFNRIYEGELQAVRIRTKLDVEDTSEYGLGLQAEFIEKIGLNTLISSELVQSRNLTAGLSVEDNSIYGLGIQAEFIEKAVVTSNITGEVIEAKNLYSFLLVEDNSIYGLGIQAEFIENIVLGTTIIKEGDTRIPAAKPSAPSYESRTPTSITLNTITNGLYRRGAGAWQESPVFSGLSPNTSYQFTQKVAETVEYLESPVSDAANISTPKYSQDPPNKPTLYSKGANWIQLNTIVGAEYKILGGLWDWQDSPYFGSGIYPNTQYSFVARLKETATHYQSAQSVNANFTTLKYDNPYTPPTPALNSKTQTVIVVDAVSGCEYSINGGAWQYGTTFTGLQANTSYTICQRYYETNDTYASEESCASFTTDAASPQLAQPSVGVIEDKYCKEVEISILNSNAVGVNVYAGGSFITAIAPFGSANAIISHNLNGAGGSGGGMLTITISFEASGYTSSNTTIKYLVSATCSGKV